MAGVRGQRSGGQNRLTTAQHLARGTFRKDRHGKRADVLVKPAALVMPERLSGSGRELWRTITEGIPTLTRLDALAVTVLCDLAEHYEKLYSLFSANPLDRDVRVAYMCVLVQFDRIGMQFGCTPLSRQTLAPTQPGASDDDDPMEHLVERLTQ